MVKHTGSYLDEELGEYKDYGFSLKAPDDHLLELYYKDHRLAVYNQTRVTADIIKEGCRNYLKSIARWKE